MKPTLHALMWCSSLLSSINVCFSQPPANDNCGNATILYSNAVCFPANQTTVGGSTQGGEVISPSCISQAANQTVWYKFQATSSSMYVETQLTNITGPGNGFNDTKWVTVVYNTSNCMPVTGNIISCRNENSQGIDDDMILNHLTSLTVGNWYLIQVAYRTGSFKSPVFCLNVGDDYTTCSSCASPCGNACELSTAPSVAEVTANCPGYIKRPYLEGSENLTECYTFTPTCSTVSFGIVINSTCPNQPNSWGVVNDAFVSASNVTAFSWTVQPTGCGSSVNSGSSIASMSNIGGLTPGISYTLCYSLTAPVNCFQTTYYPYYYCPTILPIELSSFTAISTFKGTELNWTTESELNNSHFLVQHSADGNNFEDIAKVDGAGSSELTHRYSYIDEMPLVGMNFYRLAQIDFDGSIHYSDVVSVDISSDLTTIALNPNPVLSNDIILTVNGIKNQAISIKISNSVGESVYISNFLLHEGNNFLQLDCYDLPPGIYNLSAIAPNIAREIKFVKY